MKTKRKARKKEKCFICEKKAVKAIEKDYPVDLHCNDHKLVIHLCKNHVPAKGLHQITIKTDKTQA